MSDAVKPAGYPSFTARQLREILDKQYPERIMSANAREVILLEIARREAVEAGGK